MKKAIVYMFLTALLLHLCPFAFAAEPGPKEIYTVDDLLAVAEDPSGSYTLMNDLDMTGVDWKPVDLVGGSFDGNGHAILNLTITQVGNTTDISYDGNRKEYETSFAGFFGILRDATVMNLQLINIRAVVECDTPCFLGGLAGAMYDSMVTDCTVSGTLELRAFDRMFGVGGLAGYGSGAMERCGIDVTLICTDTGVDTLDEQFMGGAYATGFIDVVDCSIVINGYSSEYGYAHNGGIIGMVMQNPLGTGRTGRLTGNSISGRITFFECNADRRAYCDAYVGETLASAYSRKNNRADFVRDERKDYSAELRPEMCAEAVYSETVTAPGCDSYGYTEFTCQTCGYTYRDHYTLPAHNVTNWTVTEEPTFDAEGLSTGSCDGCGMEFTQPIPVLEPIPTETTAPTAPAPTEAAPVEEPEAKSNWLLIVGGVAVVVLIFLICLPKRKGKYQQ